MCLLTFFPDGVYPNKDAIEGLQRGAKFNSDGHGYAMIAEGRILSRKGMDADDVLDSFLTDRALYPGGPALFHSRIGTDGSLSTDNCHPFQIGKDERTVLAHNGILPSLARPTEKHDIRSDTRILAEELLPEKPFGNFRTRLAREAFEAWLGPFNKIVILTTNPIYPNNAMIFNAHKGDWDHDVWWSNDSYCPYYGKGYYSTTTVIGGSKKKHSDCTLCGEAESVDIDYNVCWSCGTCNDCQQSWTEGNCQCYNRTRGGITKYTTPAKDIFKTPLCEGCSKDLDNCKCDEV